VGSVTVKVVKDFKDKENELKLRKTGDLFSISPDRADYLIELGFVEIISSKTTKSKA